MTSTSDSSLPVTRGEPTDHALAERVAAGDRRAEEALYRRHAPRVLRIASLMAGDPQVGADLSQDVFMRVFRRIGQFRGEAAFTTWLHRVTVTTCLNGLRSIKRRGQHERPLTPTLAAHAAGPDADPASQLAIVAAVESLPARWRGPLVLHTIEGFGHKEVAELLGITEGTSKRLVSEARAKLRVSLALDAEGSLG